MKNEKDPLSLIKNEILNRTNQIQSSIQAANAQRCDIMEKINFIKNEHEKSLKQLELKHKNDMENINSNFVQLKENKVSFFHEQSKTKITQIDNQFQSDDKQIEKEIVFCKQELSALKDAKDSPILLIRNKYQLMIDPFEDSIRLDKAKIIDLQSKIHSFRSKHETLNQRNRIQKVRKIKDKLNSCQKEISNFQLNHNQIIDHLDNEYEKMNKLYRYEIQKLRKNVDEENQRIQELKQNIFIKNEDFKLQMKIYNEKISKLEIKVPLTPSQSSIRQWKVNEFHHNMKIKQLTDTLQSLHLQLDSLRQQNNNYRFKIRSLTFKLSGKQFFVY